MTLMRELAESLSGDAPNLLAEYDLSERRGRRNQRFLENAIEFVELLADVREGKRRQVWLTEAMTRDDFPNMFAFTVERYLLSAYEMWPQTWQNIARRRTTGDFRNIEVRRRAFGGGTRLLEVPELAEYPEANLTEQDPITYRVKKFGRTLGFSFELSIGDIFNELEGVPDELGMAARETENYLVTELYAASTGPHASLYTAPNGNIVTGNPALSIVGLQTAMTVLSSMVDEQGRPIFIRGFTLVVPPALRVVGENILNMIQLELTSAGGTVDNPASGTTGGQRVVTRNWLAGQLRLVVDPYLPLVNTTSGNTNWYLFANPNESAGSALEIAFLRGYEAPQVILKSSNAVRPGGGPVDPMEGDFENDAIMYRIRHIVGGAQVSPKHTVASNGTGA